MYATNVCRRDGDVLFRTNTLEDELRTRVPLLLKKLTSILPPYRVCARRPCWRSKTIKLFSFGKKFNCHAKIILLFTPPTWPLRTDSIC